MNFKSRQVIVIGAGGHARVVLSMMKQLGEQAAYILDDDASLHGTRFKDLPVRGDTAMLRESDRAIIAVGDNRNRRMIARNHPKSDYRTYIHPSAIVDDNVEIGAGSIIMAGAVIQAGARLGSHVIVNSGVVIDHDNHVEDYCHLAPNSTLAGGCTLKEGGLIGAGATVIEGLTLGEWAVVGAGACVIRDVEPGQTVVGVPARPLGGAHE